VHFVSRDLPVPATTLSFLDAVPGVSEDFRRHLQVQLDDRDRIAVRQLALQFGLGLRRSLRVSRLK
jgi:hypothetical protein